MLYSAVFILVTWFLAVLLAIYNRNASPTGLKARRAQELRGSVEWDRGLAESEARARTAQWVADYPRPVSRLLSAMSALGGGFNRSTQHLLSCQMRRDAYGGDGPRKPDKVHA